MTPSVRLLGVYLVLFLKTQTLYTLKHLGYFSDPVLGFFMLGCISGLLFGAVKSFELHVVLF